MNSKSKDFFAIDHERLSKRGARIGIDLGGTKIEGLAIDSLGNERFRRRIPTPQGNYQGTIDALCSLVKGIEKDLGSGASIGIAIPGAVSPQTGLIKNSNSLCLIGHPLDRDLERALGRPVRLANDANCFALSEATDGAASGARVVFGVILGTGTGGGVVFNGKAWDGPNSIAGEWGHNPLPWIRAEEMPGPQCYCGKRACIEMYLSGPGFMRDFRESTGREVVPSEIIAAAISGEPLALAALDRYEDRLARSLASVINLLDPEVIVLGGGMSNIERLYEHVPQVWGKYVFSDQVITQLVKAKHGDSSGVRGAAWLWP